MTVAHFTSTDIERASSRRRTATAIRIGLLGLGQVGSAVARLSAARPLSRSCGRRHHRRARARSAEAARDGWHHGHDRPRRDLRHTPLGHRRGAWRSRARPNARARGDRSRDPGGDRQQVVAGPPRRRARGRGRARRRATAVRGERSGRRAFPGHVRVPPVCVRPDVHHRHRQRHDKLHPVADGGRNERLRLGAR